jgi:hypothetical protein
MTTNMMVQDKTIQLNLTTEPEEADRCFTYSTLPDPATHIRLIEVDSYSDRHQTTSLFVRTTTVATAPPYHAISYTWGDIANQEKIYVSHRDGDSVDIRDGATVKDGLMTVRQNCADVLRQLTHFATTKYYWIDAICINQADMVEKECQVAMMSETFGRAEVVLACIGMHHDDSEFTASMLYQFDQYLGDAGYASIALTAQARRYPSISNLKEMEICIRTCNSWIDSIDTQEFERFYKGLSELTRRPYFWRIWVLQELFVAQQIRILCGYDEFWLSTLLLWWRESKAYYLGVYPEHNAQLEHKFSECYLQGALWNSIHYFQEHGGSGLGTEFEEMLYERQSVLPIDSGFSRLPLSTRRLLNMCQNRVCQDPRDCIFGTLTIGSWTTRYDPITPDYTLSAFHLAKIIMVAFDYIPQIAKLAVGLLGLKADDLEIREGIGRRQQLVPQTSAQFDEDYRSYSKQDSVEVLENAIQLITGSPWMIDANVSRACGYTCINDEQGRRCAVACTTAEIGDWLVPTLSGRGFILRQRSDYCEIIGKAWCLPDLVPQDLNKTAYLQLGVDDLLIHLVAVSQSLETYNIDPPSNDLVLQLNVPFCAEFKSSIATKISDPPSNKNQGTDWASKGITGTRNGQRKQKAEDFKGVWLRNISM